MNKVPAGWRIVRLAEVAGKPQYGWTSSARAEALGLPLLRTTDITNGLVDWAGVPRCTTDPADAARYLLRTNDIVVSRAGSVGVSALIDQPPRAIFASYLMRLRPGDLVLPRFLALYLASPSYWQQISDVTNGIALPNINGTKLGAVRMPLPPLEEQRRIVDILEDHLSRLDAGVSGLRRGANHLPVLRLSALSEARRTLLERGAPLVPVSAITSTALGKMLDAKKAAGDPTPYLRNINVRWGAFNLDDVATVQLTTDERERFALRRGDLLVCEGGEPGRCAVWPGGDSLIAYQKALHRVRVLDPERTNVYFLAAMLEEFIRAGRADRLFTGTTIKHLPQEKLRLINIPMPGVAHQEAAVDRLGRLDEAASRLRTELASQTARAGLLRRALLDAAFSGRLLGRSSDSDRVEELAGV